MNDSSYKLTISLMIWFAIAGGFIAGWIIGALRKRRIGKDRIKASDDAIRCQHGKKKWELCRSCAEAFAHCLVIWFVPLDEHGSLGALTKSGKLTGCAQEDRWHFKTYEEAESALVQATTQDRPSKGYKWKIVVDPYDANGVKIDLAHQINQR